MKLNLSSKLTALALLFVIVMQSNAQQTQSCYTIPDLDGYKKAYKINQNGALGYKEFYKLYKDQYVDSAYYIANSLKSLAKVPAKWRLTDQAGVAVPYCGSLSELNSNNGIGNPDENMFLQSGGYNNLEADRFFGKKGIFGLGVLGGYAFYRVDKDALNKKYAKYQQTAGVNSAGVVTRSKPYEVFSLLVGPVATFGLGKKLNLDLTAKAGPTHNDVAYAGQDSKTTSALAPNGTSVQNYEVIHRTQPTDKRWSLGGNLGARLMYKLNERWGLGLNANAFSARKVEYEVMDPISTGNGYRVQSTRWNRTQSNFNAGLAVQHIWPNIKKPVYVPLVRLDPPVANAVAVAPSLQQPCNQVFSANKFNNEITWISNDNLEDKANEQFIVKLFKVPGKEPILVKTVKGTSLKLDSPLLAPSDICASDEYYYTIHAVKGSSFSELVTCSFKIKNENADGAKCGNCPEAVTAGPAASPVYLTRILGNESYTRQIIKYDEGKGCKCPIDTLTKSGSRLVEYFKQYTNNDQLNNWPSSLPIPRKASSFIYEVREVFEPGAETASGKGGTVTRYRMSVDRRTREVTLTPISSGSSRKRKR